MALWAVLLIGMAAAGIWLLIRTNPHGLRDSTSRRPQQHHRSHHPTKWPRTTTKRCPPEWPRSVHAENRQSAMPGESVKAYGASAAWRFAAFPGAWENVPGETCP